MEAEARGRNATWWWLRINKSPCILTDCIKQRQEWPFMQCGWCPRPCTSIVFFILHNNPMNLVPLLVPFGTQGNWDLELRVAFPRSPMHWTWASLTARSVSLTKLCFSEVSVACPLKFQGELVRWGSLWISSSGCHFRVLSLCGGRVTHSGCGNSRWLDCSPLGSLWVPSASNNFYSPLHPPNP